MSPRWAPLHTRTRPASLYLNIQCARSSLTLITSPPASQPLCPLSSDTLLPFPLFSSTSPSSWLLSQFFGISFSGHVLHHHQHFSLIYGQSPSRKTLVQYFSQASNTHNLFFSVTIPQTSSYHPCVLLLLSNWAARASFLYSLQWTGLSGEQWINLWITLTLVIFLIIQPTLFQDYQAAWTDITVFNRFIFVTKSILMEFLWASTISHMSNLRATVLVS